MQCSSLSYTTTYPKLPTYLFHLGVSFSNYATEYRVPSKHVQLTACLAADRPLQHINKKGRPVSQCQHCRSMRKSRSAHIKCDCGEKTSKCAHLQPLADGHRGESALRF